MSIDLFGLDDDERVIAETAAAFAEKHLMPRWTIADPANRVLALDAIGPEIIRLATAGHARAGALTNSSGPAA